MLYVSIHVDPTYAFPYYWGYPDQTGEAFFKRWRALDAVACFSPDFLVVSLGTDVAADDPLSGFALPVQAFNRLGRRVGALGVPVLTVQEGGYEPATMGACVVEFLDGLQSGRTRHV